MIEGSDLPLEPFEGEDAEHRVRPAMNGDEVLRVLAESRTNEIVVTTMSAAREWPRFSHSPLDVPMIGSMGKASSLGMGIALARPERRVLVLDGDGSLLMNLGALVTIAHVRPPNLVHFVFENGTYDTTGGQPIPGAGVVDFTGLALEAGYPGAYEFDDLGELAATVPTLLTEDGPILVDLKIEAGWSATPFPARGTAEALEELTHVLSSA